jgi:hypothetical protein
MEAEVPAAKRCAELPKVWLSPIATLLDDPAVTDDYRSQHVHVRRNGRAKAALFDDAVGGVLGEVRECGCAPREGSLGDAV